jgi:hypothetical protein
MLRRFVRKASGRSFASLLLLAFIVRSLIPAGYMPAADRPFALQICPDGLPAHAGQAAHLRQQEQPSPAAQHAGHMHAAQAGEHAAPDPHSTHKSWTHCPFAGLAGAPLPLDAATPAQSAEATAPAILDTDARFVSTTRFCIAQPRAPPILYV